MQNYAKAEASISTFTVSVCYCTWPACDSDPGTQPNPPSKFIHDITKLTAFFTSTASNLPYKYM